MVDRGRGLVMGNGGRGVLAHCDELEGLSIFAGCALKSQSARQEFLNGI